MTDRVALRLAGGHLVMERPEAPVRLLIFHHAAGSAMSFSGLARSLSRLSEPVLIELPGRGNRAREPHAKSFADAVSGLLPAVLSLIDRPVVVLGHSLGALIAHSVLHEMTAEHRRRVRAVVVSAAKAPATAAALATFPDGPFQARTRESLLADLDRFGGIPAGLLADPEVRDHAVTLLGHDLHLADTYRQPPAGGGAVPYQFWFGSGDTSLSREEGARWAAGVGRPVPVQEFEGGHFYLQAGPAAGVALDTLIETEGSIG
ncbi:thioesterase II family protein [Paractinoplanes brasiliensis]|uniref:Surfactin synthase thioesterase subunit n=1 Tax=Paractinoplanes brasiliensis TaxID=52695 RepID=A0A4R6K2X4_9ACTN|nr:alpha/beta fold hydrolase [Actinoplanes brasiliensis]TDO42026.1 surfactin synthase thioesterase subunit [Actinoplanes brasiliensis]GID33097.1 thioesterase [Actinoplanes brasiliensis]